MGDLISRKTLIEEVENFSLKISGSANAMALVIMDETKKAIMKIIGEQPVAYDLDKVINEINAAIEPIDQCTHRFCRSVAVEDCDKYADCESCMAEQIIGIVKSGWKEKTDYEKSTD